MDITKLNYISESVTDKLGSKPRLVIDPRNLSKIIATHNTSDIDINIYFDAEPWIITDEMKEYISELNANSNLNTEQKIIEIYVKLCNDFVYDDNVLSYLTKTDDDTFFLPDAYGRDTTPGWKENRSTHNRRNCFEISRILAKSISTMIKNSSERDSYETCILWDESNTHYFVGLANNDYCLTLDLDDFNMVKDLTRVKTGLTINGISFADIIESENTPESVNRMKNALKDFNVGRYKKTVDYIKNKRVKNMTEGQEKNKSIIPNEIQFLKDAVEILINEYDLDSAGLFEYMKEIVDRTLGSGARRKVWKEVNTSPGKGQIFTRCLIVSNENQNENSMYVIDVTKKGIDEIFHKIDKEDISRDQNSGKFIIGLHRDFKTDPYDGR